MLPSLADQISTELKALRHSSRLRTCQTLHGNSRISIHLHGRSYVSFCTNDYLGLAADPRLQRAASEAACASGFGAGASRLVSGSHAEHIALEKALATYLALPAALLFPTGYQANLGVLTALAGPEDLIVADRAVHASIIDGCRLSGAKLTIYPHLDAEIAERHLKRLGPTKRRRFLVTESLFSMDGDFAPLQDLAAIATSHDAALIVDEAHSIGCLGPSGRGLCAEHNVQPDILIGTFGKTFGTSGAFVAGTADLRDYLVNRARTFIFTTALPIPITAATTAALSIVESPEGDNRRALLTLRSKQLHTALHYQAERIHSPIVPIIIGSDDLTIKAASHLLANGFFVQAIRPPSVREGTSRLRVTLSSLHSEEEVHQLAAALASIPAKPLSPPPSRATSQITNPSIPRPCTRETCSASTARGIILLGTDTAVGKTTVAIALLHILATRGTKPVPFKPVETGAQPLPSDAVTLLSASQRDDIPLSAVCPFAFQEPLAPAAANTGVPLSLNMLLNSAHHAATYGSPLVVETAGGLLSPYATHLTPLDLAAAIGFPVLLVARNGLGTINHTALATAEIHRRHLSFLGTILVTTSSHHTPDQDSNLSLISDATGHTPLGVLPFLQTQTPANLAAALTESLDLPLLLERILI